MANADAKYSSSNEDDSVGLNLSGSCINWYLILSFFKVLGYFISANIDLVVGRAVLEATPPKVVVLDPNNGSSVLLSSKVGKLNIVFGVFVVVLAGFVTHDGVARVVN